MSVSISRCEERPAVTEAAWSGSILRSMGELYCRVFHQAISRPVGGKYRCWKCLREFELDW